MRRYRRFSSCNVDVLEVMGETITCPDLTASYSHRLSLQLPDDEDVQLKPQAKIWLGSLNLTYAMLTRHKRPFYTTPVVLETRRRLVRHDGVAFVQAVQEALKVPDIPALLPQAELVGVFLHPYTKEQSTFSNTDTADKTNGIRWYSCTC